jgi:Zn-dependent peptidase ImmA (M78 family)
VNNTPHSTSVLGRLRLVTPTRSRITYDEALRVAELQASKLSELLACRPQDIAEQTIADLPRIMVTHEDLPVSGISHWNGQAWVISLAAGDGLARQRFTLLHEFKHIIDHGQTDRLYVGDRDRTSAEQAEAAADYFAGCVLVPKRDLKSIWGRGTQRLDALADYFGVSAQAIAVRLWQTKLNVERDLQPVAVRCARPIRTQRSDPQRFRMAKPGTRSRRYA